jgi:hypothetical protein
MYTRQIFGTTLDAARQRVVTKSKNEIFAGEQKGGLFSGRLCKEAKEEGKSLREGDARCSPSLRQDTRIEEVSNLGRGLKSFSFTCLFICYLYKQLGNQNS